MHFETREGFMARKKWWNINEEKPGARSSYRGVTLIEQQTEHVRVSEDRGDRHYSALHDGARQTDLGSLPTVYTFKKKELLLVRDLILTFW